MAETETTLRSVQFHHGLQHTHFRHPLLDELDESICVLVRSRLHPTRNPNVLLSPFVWLPIPASLETPNNPVPVLQARITAPWICHNVPTEPPTLQVIRQRSRPSEQIIPYPHYAPAPCQRKPSSKYQVQTRTSSRPSTIYANWHSATPHQTADRNSEAGHEVSPPCRCCALAVREEPLGAVKCPGEQDGHCLSMI
ncbi:uncharacterized protein LY79DRAFT_138490 [Colletotrichum navitas]|uniref:Uncharacterized protein n=1 Tax=Colletotrichum navitas TaxID=681940 RepID=A0AAD8VCA4_9PEZI|nr:uncharacterized protein LY79DRAFT_138490 [Colletotrichum navitas]KAK1599330.1 hypothetical protein LY79DRAFT_138490 [Colletotrichum navitas]